MEAFVVKFHQWINPTFAIAFFLLLVFTERWKRAGYRSPLGQPFRLDPIASDIVHGPVLMANFAMDDTQGTVL